MGGSPLTGVRFDHGALDPSRPAFQTPLEGTAGIEQDE